MITFDFDDTLTRPIWDEKGLWFEPSSYAIGFAENVYGELLCKNTKITVGEAIARAKRIAAEQHNFFWLLYCIYGNPDVYFELINQPQDEDKNNQ